ncbi:hypothetical protein HAHE_33690 [Haloferula helveola]|uniref:FecR protein n=1 Tax=Haloferula helveola TaxID=490095 RepID=A0ABM7RID0_9BACT|nr:hypothetical protein HAHE_33690 [Haloferula helveola]
METNPTEPTFEDLCCELLDGSLDEAGRARLTELVSEDPELRAKLQEQLVVSGALSRTNPEFSDERFSHAVSNHLRAVGDEPVARFPERITRKIRRDRFRKQAVLALAACVALATVPLVLLNRKPVESVAVAVHLPGTSDELARSEIIKAGQKIELEVGRMMRLDFGNGAVVAVEGPAEFTVRSPMEIGLKSGNLNAWCPETAHGFRVDTKSATLTDLGTSFGVSASPDGSADFMVLDGEVTVSSGKDQRNLLEGGAVRATRGAGLSDLAFEPSAFSRTWPIASGIQSTEGEVIPAPPNTPEAVANHEDDNHVIVIPEKRSFVLPERLPVDITEPGSHGGKAGAPIHSPSTLESKAGTRARSYLLRYNPVGILDFMVFKSFEGSVTFDRPVLGIITSTGKLFETDKITTNAPLPLTKENPGMRGPEAGIRTMPDTVTLSSDRKTVSVIFNAGESIDEIRVITAAD